MNKPGFVIAVAIAALLPFAASAQLPPAPSPISGPQPVRQQEQAASAALDRVVPALSRVNQILVAEPNVSDAKVVADCRLDVKAIQQNIIRTLSNEKLPVTVNSSAVRADQVSVTLKPEIAILKDGVVNCISWVSLRAESLHTLQLPPLTDRKTVNVTLWNRGGLILTPVIDHPAGVGNAFNILSNAFVKQYKLDNPEIILPGTPAPANSLNSLKRQ